MALWNNFPYSNVHELNLDWIIEKMKYLIEQWESYGTTVDADAVAGPDPEVTVEGDLKTGLTFHFTLVQGPQGVEGPQGVSVTTATMDANYQLTLYFSDGTTWTSPSLKGATGSGLQILDEYATLADLQTAHPTGDAGDAYLVGTSPNFTLYIWSTSSNAWVDGGALTNPSPSITTPLMDGIADTGSELAYSRGDHVHPSDTSKQDVLTAGYGISIDASNEISVSASIPAPSNNNPNMDGTGDAGTSANYSRADHVHPSDTSKQNLLVSGTNIKTINSKDILGSGNAVILGGIDPNNLIASGTSSTRNGLTYTASVDCFVSGYLTITYSDVQKLSVDNQEIGRIAPSNSTGTASYHDILVPLLAGQAFKIQATDTGHDRANFTYKVYGVK